jgi:hypothetical protein
MGMRRPTHLQERDQVSDLYFSFILFILGKNKSFMEKLFLENSKLKHFIQPKKS